MNKGDFLNSKIFKLTRKIFWSNQFASFLNRRLPDEKYYKKSYWWHTLRKIDFDDLHLYSEKLIALNLLDNNPLYTICTDKYLVRNYVREKLNNQFEYDICNELYFETDDYSEIDKIDFSVFPDKFVIKLNHGSGWNILIKDKNKIDEKKVKKQLKKWFKTNYYYDGRQGQYKDMKPRVIIERFLENFDGSEILDYKIMCFDGVPTTLWIDYNRHSNHVRNFYSIDGEPLFYTSDEPSDYSIPFKKPDNYDDLIKIACLLSKDFKQVRVDLYDVNNVIYFGELTFTSWGGTVCFKSKELDEFWGEKFILKEDNHE